MIKRGEFSYEHKMAGRRFYLMRKKIKTQEKLGSIQYRRTAAIFNDLALESSEMFIHCLRIPDVMVRVAKAREVLKKYKVRPPAWMFGLIDKGENFDSPTHLKLMSFLISLGLYERMVRLIGPPDFLVGSSRALLVSAKVGTFEKNVIKIFYDMKYNANYLSVYKKKPDKKITRFSLLHFSEKSEKNTFQSVAQMYKVDRCILISPSPDCVKEDDATGSFTAEGLIEMDAQLGWLWLILKRKQLAKSRRFTPGPFSLDTSFH